MLRIRHGLRLLKDLGAYAVTNRSWWIVPIVLLLLGLLALVTVGQTAVPYTVYTLF